jgi:hypothetical protein
MMKFNPDRQGNNQEENQAEEMKQVNRLVDHITGPCEIVVDGETKNIKEFYLKQGKTLLKKLKDPVAKRILKEVLDSYK